MRTLLLLAIVACLSGIVVPAQRENPASKTELDEITTRGKELAAYDVAAWYGSDAVTALSPRDGSVQRYVAKRTDKGWVVMFGHFNEAADKFLITYQAEQEASPKEFKGSKVEPPREDSGFYFHAAKAIGTAIKDFKAEQRPYNAAAIPTKSDQFFVYLLPAQTEDGVFPLGGDARFLVSADGSKIVEKRQMHISIIEYRTPPALKDFKGAMHTAVLDEIPEDSDVFHVLSRKPQYPEFVVSKKFVYYIETDGSIKYLMSTDAFTKMGKDKPSQPE